MARSSTALEVNNPFNVFESFGGVKKPNDIIEFVVSDEWLNRPNIYPRQATLLKIIFLQDELFTQYDYDVIGEWTTDGFILGGASTEDETTVKYVGDWGIQPDVLERIRYLKEIERRPWFRQTFNVSGRRGSKGYIGALGGAFVLWTYMAMGDPRYYFGVDRDKRLACQVFAGKKDQAKGNQWRDLVNVVLGAKCFEPYISQSLSESLTIFSPTDRQRLRQMQMSGRKSEMDMATFEIVPKEATAMAARGPASFMQFYDEAAHMVSTTGGSRSMAEVYDAATPSLDQFKEFAFIYSGSSPWEQTGKFHELCQQALMLEAETLAPVYPDSLLIQLASWDIYHDWERTKIAFPIRPEYERQTLAKMDGSVLSTKELPQINALPLRGALTEYDAAMKRLERANPATFRVERRAKWATAMDAYIPEEHVRRMFGPWLGKTLTMERHGSPSIDFYAHGDPGKTGSNFGFAVGHRVDPTPDQLLVVPELGMAEFTNDLPHVVFDFIHAWRPGDFERYEPGSSDPIYEMDYIFIEDDIGELLDGFLFTDLSFDQWNSLGMIQRLQKHSKQNFKPTRVWERSATAPLNWDTAETFKTALGLNLVHAPYYELAELECKFLRKLPGDKVDHPDTGPCTTKDVYDAMSIVVHKLIGHEVADWLGRQLSDLTMVGAVPGVGADPLFEDISRQFSNFGAANARNSPARGGGRFAPPLITTQSAPIGAPRLPKSQPPSRPNRNR